MLMARWTVTGDTGRWQRYAKLRLSAGAVPPMPLPSFHINRVPSLCGGSLRVCA